MHGYWSDVTRTFALPSSRIPSEHLKIWYTVKAAQEAALESAREGVRAETVDAAARAVIEAVGYGKYFTHRLGHGQWALSPYVDTSIHFSRSRHRARGARVAVPPGWIYEGTPDGEHILQ